MFLYIPFILKYAFQWNIRIKQNGQYGAIQKASRSIFIYLYSLTEVSYCLILDLTDEDTDPFGKKYIYMHSFEVIWFGFYFYIAQKIHCVIRTKAFDQSQTCSWSFLCRQFERARLSFWFRVKQHVMTSILGNTSNLSTFLFSNNKNGIIVSSLHNISQNCLFKWFLIYFLVFFACYSESHI